MSNEKKDDVVMDIEEDKDGSAIVQMPEGFDGAPEEEKVEAKADGGSVDDESDHPDDSEAVRAARRARRRSKKDFIRKTNEEKDVRLTQLQRENEDMKNRLNNLDQRVKHTEVARVDKALEDQQVRLEYAKMKVSEAASSGDGDAMVEAQELMYEARQAVDQLKYQRQQTNKPAVNIPDPRIQRNAATWMERNTWYKPDTSDTDSKIAKQLDEELSKDGWNPNEPDYWDELDNRLQKYLPHRYNGASDGNNSVRKPRNVVGSSGREASAAFGGNNRTSFVLNPERVSAMKAVGAWDNPERKKKMISEFIKFDKLNPNRS